MKSNLQTVVERSVAAVDFVRRKRESGQAFTVRELSECIGLQKPWGGYRYLDCLSRHYPIYEEQAYRRGSAAAVFRVLK